jgi:hypothetical protein
MISGILSPLRAFAQPIWLAAALCAFSFGAAAQDAGTVKPPQDRPAARNFVEEFQQSLMPVPDPKTLTVRGSVYVPAYSNIRGRTDRPGALATLLRIDNTSATKPLVLERIEYFDTGGKLVQRYVETPVAIKPFGAVQIFIPADDIRGGPASNFIVTWAGIAPMAEPVIEAVGFGKVDGAGYSFVSPGRPIRTVGKRPWLGLGLSR